MNISSRRFLTGALALMLLMSACSALTGGPTAPPGTINPTGQVTDTPFPTSTSDAGPTAFIPITGMDVVSLQCQFCVNDEVRAVLVMSNQVSFSVADPASGISCFSVQEINDKRVLLCRGAQQASFTLNVCMGEENCLQFPVVLQPCAQIPQTGIGTPFITFTPFFLTPLNTLIAPTSTPKPSHETTPTGVGPSPTVPPTTSTTEPVPTATEPVPTPTEAPTEPPTVQPVTTQPPPTTAPTQQDATEESNKEPV